VGLGFLVAEVQRSHSNTLHSVGLLWTSDRRISETSTRKTQDIDKGETSMPRWDLDPQSQLLNDRRPSLRPRGHWDRRSVIHRVCTVKTYTKVEILRSVVANLED